VAEHYAEAMTRLAGPPPWRVLVALSGGADSTALLVAAARISEPLVTACLVDHGARGEEDRAAEAFCTRLCERLGVSLLVERVTVTPADKGWEDAARRARYEALERARSQAGADRILTGHTADDVAETVLWRIARGASARGLGGIPERTGHVLRPLLGCRRGELRGWLLELGEEWLEDSTNADPRFLRNRIRADVLRALEAAVPQAVDSIAQAARLFREDDDHLDGLAREELVKAELSPTDLRSYAGKRLKLGPCARAWSASRLRILPGPLARRAVRAALVTAGVSADELTSRHIVLITENLDREGFALELPGGFIARSRRGLLLIELARDGA
jgi:tRNA(Ile)-lysidine synthase